MPPTLPAGSPSSSPHVLFETADGIATVTLNRPEKRNAFSPEMIVRLVEIWAEIAADHAVRVVLLTGAGAKAFSAGGDLGTTIPLMMRTREPVGEWEERFSADRKQLYRAILRGADFFKPVVAAINGHALAGGAEMILGTDLRVISSEATIGVTEVRRGLIAGGGSLVRLARQIPWAQAMELALVGEPITAQQAAGDRLGEPCGATRGGPGGRPRPGAENQPGRAGRPGQDQGSHDPLERPPP
jgi:enoyl-CoA hydratase